MPFWLFKIGYCDFAIKPCDGRTLWGRVKKDGMIEKYKKYKSEHSDQKFGNTEFI